MAVCTDEFFALAKTEAMGWDMPGLPLAVVPHPLAKRNAEECGEFAGHVLGEIAQALTDDPRSLAAKYRDKTVQAGSRRRYRSLFESEFNAPDAPATFKGPDSIEAMNRLFYRRGWTDGLPVLPPTPRRVEAMLAGRDPSEMAGRVEPRLGQATLGKVAANAVMAGCEPAHFPVVVAAVGAMVDESFNLKALQSTTHPCTVACLVGGGVARELEVNGAYNAFGQGSQSNAAIGRAIRLVLTNIGGASPGALDRSTMGSPAKYALCFAENDEASPWPSYHEELGLDPSDSHVTVFGVEGPHNVNDHFGRTGEEILLTIAGTLATPGANNFYLAGQPVVVIGPEHAEVIAADGFSKMDVKRFLSERAVVPRHVVSDAMVEELAVRLPHHLLGTRGDDGVRFVTDPDQLIVLVAGGAGRHSAVLPTFGGSTHAVTRRIELMN